ncbi:MAG TPA: DUF2080 family transposase-associated protein [Candidatus Nanoarchaeia archaeon]|nr:DUF2080 family transposase-associated protein [Candidatus Nanoarchaeia archaeon]
MVHEELADVFGREQIIRNVTRIGNGAHIFAPKEWLGERVIIVRSLKPSLKERILKIIEPHLESILGVYLYGSYARGEQSEGSDIDVLVIAKNKFKIGKKDNFEFLVLKESFLEPAIKINPILMYSIFKEAKAIINQGYLEKYKKININKKYFKPFINSTKGSIKSNEELLELDKKTGKTASNSIVYSCMLRLRGIFIINCLVDGGQFSNKNFQRWLKENVNLDYSKIYYIYRKVRDEKSIKDEISLTTGADLVNFLRDELNKLAHKINSKKHKASSRLNFKGT